MYLIPSGFSEPDVRGFTMAHAALFVVTAERTDNLGKVIDFFPVNDRVVFVHTHQQVGQMSIHMYRVSVCGKPVMRSSAQSAEDGFVVCIDTVCQGVVPAVHTEDPPGAPSRPVVFATEREAQLEIVDNMMTRLQCFVDGSIDEFYDVITCSEFILTKVELDLKYNPIKQP